MQRDTCTECHCCEMPEVHIEFEATVPTMKQVESRDFARTELVSDMRDYVAAQLGVEPYTIQLRAQHSKHGAWFLLALYETMDDISEYHYVRCTSMPLGLPLHKLQIHERVPEVGEVNTDAVVQEF